jgi:hypothetical protein
MEAVLLSTFETINVSNSDLPIIDIGGVVSNSVTNRKAVGETLPSMTADPPVQLAP